jgi:pimeloyl-ACP methyl ester carboxylesterase
MVLTVGERRLAASLFTAAAERPQPGLLFVHGMHSDRGGYGERARAVVDALGITCLTFDLGGHGESNGKLARLTPRDHIDDVTAAYDFLARHPAVDPTWIGVCGASYGGYLGAILTGRRVVRKLLLRAPGLYDDDQLDRPLSVARHSDLGSSIATRSLSEFDGDVLVVESGADEVIPHAVVAAYLTACPRAAHVLMPDATHALTEPAWRQRFLYEILRFFADRAGDG